MEQKPEATEQQDQHHQHHHHHHDDKGHDHSHEDGKPCDHGHDHEHHHHHHNCSDDNERFDANSQFYSDNVEPLTMAMGIELGTLMEISKANKVIEIGCGPGGLSLYWLPRIAKLEKFVSLDLSEKMLAVANKKKKAQHLDKLAHEFVAKDMSDLSSFTDGYFDAYFGVLCLHHSSDVAKTLKEANRVLRKGGRIGFVEMGETENNFHWIIRKEIKAAGGKVHEHHHNWLQTKEKLFAALVEGGFKVEFYWPQYSPLPIYTEQDLIDTLEKNTFFSEYNNLDQNGKDQVKGNLLKVLAQYQKENKAFGMPAHAIICTKI